MSSATLPSHELHEPMSSRTRRIALFLLLAVVLARTHLALHGYSFGGCTPRHAVTSPSSDHANLIPWIHWYNDHSLYSKDFQIQLHAEYATLLWPAVAFVVRSFDIEWTFFVAHCLTLLATFALLLLF